MEHQLRINTRITDIKGKVLPVKISFDYYSCRIIYKNDTIGQALYTVEDDHIYINRMNNYTIETENPLKHVGSALFECIFKRSLELGKGGIELQSIEKSSAAYYKMGLRKQSNAFNILEKQINAYKNKPNNTNKNKITKDDYWYEELKGEAAIYLNKDAKSITFDEAINYGRYSDNNNQFEELLKEKSDLTWGDCYEYRMQSYMYLPKESIEANIQKFSIYNFCPIGSNLAAGDLLWQGHTSRKLAYDKLTNLVQQGVLDPANAIEISYKYQCKSITKEQVDLMLSDVGLELMSRNYVSGWYMAVYLQNKLSTVVSEEFLGYFNDGTLPSIDDYISNNYEIPKLGENLHNME